MTILFEKTPGVAGALFVLHSIPINLWLKCIQWMDAKQPPCIRITRQSPEVSFADASPELPGRAQAIFTWYSYVPSLKFCKLQEIRPLHMSMLSFRVIQHPPGMHKPRLWDAMTLPYISAHTARRC